MKALFIYNSTSGKGKIVKKRGYIVSELKKVYSVLDEISSTSEEHFIKCCKEACGKYDALIFAGGDGTFNMVANAIAEEKERPILGVIPTGTINDAAKNFGITSNLKKAVKIIKNQRMRKFDIGKINDMYFVFTVAVGAYADIPITTTKEDKKRIGPLAYYFNAFPSFFKLRKVEGDVTIDDREMIHYKTPFVLVMNSTHVGGFNINPKSDIYDGKMDLFLVRPGIFNSLLHYLFFRHKIKHYQGSKLEITVDCDDNWDVDGEKGPSGNVTIEVIHNHLTIFCKK